MRGDWKEQTDHEASVGQNPLAVLPLLAEPPRGSALLWLKFQTQISGLSDNVQLE